MEYRIVKNKYGYYALEEKYNLQTEDGRIRKALSGGKEWFLKDEIEPSLKYEDILLKKLSLEDTDKISHNSWEVVDE